jgi:hypothetical protein
LAAGAAYQVDTADVSDAGNCKVESWVSFASNRDFFAAVSPSCAMNVGRPLELSIQASRGRSDGEWATGLAPKAKLNIVPTAIGSFGLALSATAGYDMTTRETTGFTIAAPVTLRLSDVMRINLNAGWQWDRLLDRHYLYYGVGYDWRTPDNVYTFTAEVFGLAGSADDPSVTRPRFQTGFRWRPIDRWSVDLIYGRNITGENANWLTIATILRFPAEGKQADK